MTAQMTMGGAGYLYVYMGTGEQAAAADKTAYIPFVEEAAGAHTYTVPVDEALAAHIARMTPMLADVDRDKLDLSVIHSITIDENMIVGTLKESEE